MKLTSTFLAIVFFCCATVVLTVEEVEINEREPKDFGTFVEGKTESEGQDGKDVGEFGFGGTGFNVADIGASSQRVAAFEFDGEDGFEDDLEEDTPEPKDEIRRRLKPRELLPGFPSKRPHGRIVETHRYSRVGLDDLGRMYVIGYAKPYTGQVLEGQVNVQTESSATSDQLEPYGFIGTSSSDARQINKQVQVALDVGEESVHHRPITHGRSPLNRNSHYFQLQQQQPARRQPNLGFLTPTHQQTVYQPQPTVRLFSNTVINQASSLQPTNVYTGQQQLFLTRRSQPSIIKYRPQTVIHQPVLQRRNTQRDVRGTFQKPAVTIFSQNTGSAFGRGRPAGVVTHKSQFLNTGLSGVSPLLSRTSIRNSGQNPIRLDGFGNIQTDAFGLRNFGRDYVNIEQRNFDDWRTDARSLVPSGALSRAQNDQVVIGQRYRTGFARQTESTSAERKGSGSGSSGIELSATRTASQDANQQFSQTASGKGRTEQGATYGFQRQPNFAFKPVEISRTSFHSGPRSTLPANLRSQSPAQHVRIDRDRKEVIVFPIIERRQLDIVEGAVPPPVHRNGTPRLRSVFGPCGFDLNCTS